MSNKNKRKLGKQQEGKETRKMQGNRAEKNPRTKGVRERERERENSGGGTVWEQRKTP